MMLKFQMKNLKRQKHSFYVFQNITVKNTKILKMNIVNVKVVIVKKKQIAYFTHNRKDIKKHENDYGFAGLDGTGELLLLPKLVEKLKESGVDKKYFQPIISKSKKILGYTFITDNILPQKSYIDENYKFENQCEKCGRINMTENENIFHFIPKRITEEGIKNLKDVNKTYEFYDEYREIVINKKVAQIIKENVPYVKFYPVILDNRN